MFIRRSTYRQLADRADAYDEAYVWARRAEHRKAAPAVARLQRMAKACGRYRAELAQQRAKHTAALGRQQRRIDLLQAQLDELLGMNSDQVLAGTRWQQRRPDKPYTASTVAK